MCRLNTTDNKTAHVLYDTIGDKRYLNGYTFLHIQFAFEVELISFFYKMYYNIRPGLGLQYVIVVFPDHTHLIFLVFNMHSRKRIKMHYGRHRKCRKDGVFFLFLLKYMLVNSYLICDSSNSMI